MKARATYRTVIARFNRAIQHSKTLVGFTCAAGYWMPRFRGA